MVRRWRLTLRRQDVLGPVSQVRPDPAPKRSFLSRLAPHPARLRARHPSDAPHRNRAPLGAARCRVGNENRAPQRAPGRQRLSHHRPSTGRALLQSGYPTASAALLLTCQDQVALLALPRGRAAIMPGNLSKTGACGKAFFPSKESVPPCHPDDHWPPGPITKTGPRRREPRHHVTKHSENRAKWESLFFLCSSPSIPAPLDPQPRLPLHPRKRAISTVAHREEYRMRLGLFMMPLHPPTRSLHETLEEDTEKALLADRLGFSDLWVGEHFFGPLRTDSLAAHVHGEPDPPHHQSNVRDGRAYPAPPPSGGHRGRGRAVRQHGSRALSARRRRRFAALRF